MKTAKGLHLWLATFGYWNTRLYITTRLRAPQVAIKRAQQAAKDQGITRSFEKIEYQGTIDA